MKARIIKRAAIVLVLFFTAIFLTVAISNLAVLCSPKEKSAIDKVSGNFDCIIVLGAFVYEDGTLCPMLADRMDTAITLYKNGTAPKLLLTGDHGGEDYDEVDAMKNYALEKGVPKEDIFLDHAGFSTYDSILRAKEVFGAKNAVVVTQKFHLDRALYIAGRTGLSAVGVNSDPREYDGILYNELREIPARTKTFFLCLFRISPKYLGDPVNLSGSGNCE